MENRLVRLCRPEDAALIEHLHKESFGPGRFARTAYRVREQAAGAGFGLTAWRDGELAGAVHLTPVAVGGRSGAWMLGPLAVAPRFKGQGFGRWLVEEGVAQARALDGRLVILVGDLPYYARLGFRTVPAGRMILPGPVAPERLLVRALCDSALEGYAGLVAGSAGSGDQTNCIGVLESPLQTTDAADLRGADRTQPLLGGRLGVDGK